MISLATKGMLGGSSGGGGTVKVVSLTGTVKVVRLVGILREEV